MITNFSKKAGKSINFYGFGDARYKMRQVRLVSIWRGNHAKMFSILGFVIK